ncbi:MAG: type II toxin-antitoxin system HicA family toxin, partial [Synergistaceae bacterium]|nr:type II toxin-antitoxin system HicA family toxin [Synergistaceae bacterium]
MGRSWSSREVIQVLRSEGWYFTDAVGDHYHFKHAVKTGKATVTHPKKDVS